MHKPSENFMPPIWNFCDGRIIPLSFAVAVSMINGTMTQIIKNGSSRYLFKLKFYYTTSLSLANFVAEPARRMPGSSAFSAYVQYASGASSLPPRYPLKAKWYYQFSTVIPLYIFIDTTNRTLYDSRPSLLIKHGGVKWLKIQNYLACQRQAADGC